jgi:N-sulfoglucosamine sulfohydrolase
MKLLSSLALCASLIFPVAGETAPASNGKPLNIVLITADDMNNDSIGAFGCKIPGITPNLDALAKQGMKFQHAHVTIAVCQPSRQAIMTGRYPHTNGAPGFDPISDDVPTLTERLRKAGYLNGILGKEIHLQPMARFCWDHRATQGDLADGAGIGRSVEKYHEQAKKFMEDAIAQKKPFFLMANMHDPHRPFAGSDQELKAWGKDLPTFRRKIEESEIEVPGFLPDLPEIRKEIAEYYTSVHRCDEVAGAVLAALRETGQEENTLVMFLSDNGMAFPFAKSNCYLQSTKTPWIVRWPGTVKAGVTDSEHPISSIDYMPTVLDALGLDDIKGMNGTSFLPVLKGQGQPEREYVFTEYHRTHANNCYPMRAVQGNRFGYLVNFWAGRTGPMRMESLSGLTYKAMKAAAKDNPEIAARVKLFEHRVLEEFFDFEKDPDAMHNLIDSPEHQDEIAKMRAALAAEMKATDDPALEAFLGRDDPAKLDEFMKQQETRKKH